MADNFIKGVGRLATDRYDFEKHVNGSSFQHDATVIQLNPHLTVSSVERTTVQEFCTAALPYLAPPTIPDADISGTKGLITLAGGDLAGAGSSATSVQVSGIQGRPVLPTSPTSGYVLMWNGSGYWEPAAIPLQISLPAGDISGDGCTTLNPKISGATGIADFFTMRCGHINFLSTVTPSIGQTITTSGSAHNMTITAQSSSISTGGSLNMSAGFGVTGDGSLKLQMQNNSVTLAELAEPVAGNFVVSLVRGSPITSAQMPPGTGNKVIYIGNAATVPTVNPTSGAILYADSGALWIKESGGDNFKISNNSKLVYQSSSWRPNISSYTYGWKEFFSTTMTNYDDVMSTNSYEAQTGDIVKITFSGYVGNSSGKSGYVALFIRGLLGDILVPGCEIYLSSTSPTQVSMTGIYTIVAKDTIKAAVAMKTDSSNAGTMYMYGGASLIIEIIRP